MHEKIHVRAEFVIEKGNLDEYKNLIREMSKAVEANEPSVIDYQFYINDDGTKCMAHETYVNSEAVIAHNNSIASQTILPKIFKIAKINRLDFYGNPSKELQEILTNFNTQTFNLFTGFSRSMIQ